MERFWSKVDVKGPDDCWLWLAGKNQDGYGNFGFESRCIGAHRMAYELSVGPIPDNIPILHKCDTRNCVNPRHLFLGTQEDNIKDCVKKGRFRSHIGIQNNHASFTEEDVLAIREYIQVSSTSLMDLAIMYGVSKSAIAHIVKRRSWKHI